MPRDRRDSHAVPRDKGTPQDPLERIAGINGVLAYWNAELKEAVAEARRMGFTWREIGRALGVSPQAAAMRFGPGGATDVSAPHHESGDPSPKPRRKRSQSR